MRVIPDRYNTEGPWYKGQTHIHTSRSDGGKSPEATLRMYAKRDYDFVFITDHNRALTEADFDDLSPLVLSGAEISGEDESGVWYHAVALGCRGKLVGSASFDVQTAFLQRNGAVVVLAHPHWSGNTGEDALRHSFDGVEVYNSICHYLNGKGGGAFHWDRLLRSNPRALGLAADDAHLQPGQPWDRAWIMVAAERLTGSAVMQAVRTGNFYSTQGPWFESIHVREDYVHVRTSPVTAIRLIDEGTWGQRICPGKGKTVTHAEFDVEGEHAYLRVEIEDERGRLAWTNALLER